MAFDGPNANVTSMTPSLTTETSESGNSGPGSSRAGLGKSLTADMPIDRHAAESAKSLRIPLAPEDLLFERSNVQGFAEPTLLPSSEKNLLPPFEGHIIVEKEPLGYSSDNLGQVFP